MSKYKNIVFLAKGFSPNRVKIIYPISYLAENEYIVYKVKDKMRTIKWNQLGDNIYVE